MGRILPLLLLLLLLLLSPQRLLTSAAVTPSIFEASIHSSSLATRYSSSWSSSPSFSLLSSSPAPWSLRASPPPLSSSQIYPPQLSSSLEAATRKSSVIRLPNRLEEHFTRGDRNVPDDTSGQYSYDEHYDSNDHTSHKQHEQYTQNDTSRQDDLSKHNGHYNDYQNDQSKAYYHYNQQDMNNLGDSNETDYRERQNGHNTQYDGSTTLWETEEEKEEKHKEGGENEEIRKPHLGVSNTHVRVHLGESATLDCLIYEPSDEPVSWLRRVDDVLELLTWSTHTYTSDTRYSLIRESGDRWRSWQLVIHDTQLEDEGQYCCQVATQPPLLLSATLTVIEPRARVVDERGRDVEEKHYNSGSMIELKCVIDQVPFPSRTVTWRRGTTILVFNTSRGGISVRGDATWGYVRSRLYIADTTPADSGVYSCWYSNYTSDTVTVHVLAVFRR
ncbi:uncharacterized protein [Cherax quadricarinatus]|uniref:uncharacterized protein isoform X2 n=1 Tax=Cherax quadricarinatus TaxID=27406 RepID=UPI0023785968|nr:uncharacterized protein LOC128700557 isoform X2 [Cherax quadricarinatus]